ncbi:MAG: hypothetical protein KJP23_04460 [Deltaproteobacteria bacterium]|nr:hypothetical protein [Deltaproteobacteria bacterium]
MAGEITTDPLLTTKLHRPSVDRSYVPRPHLLERLDQSRRRPLTLVSAPAGYGKSVLISSWLKSCDIPGAWVSLDENDNDLQMFMAYFVAAVESLFPGACRNTHALLNAFNMPSMEVLSTNLLNELDQIEHSYIIVLDDFYIIKETVIHDLLAAILKHPPQSLHLVIVGRRDPPLPITKLRAKNWVTEFRTQDLRFTVAETEMFLEQVLEIPIDLSTAMALEEKTEGWVTGLRLAALSMRHRSDIDPKLLEPQVDAQYVMEYLFSEVFSYQPSETIQYLLGCAILGRFCGPLCEAVCMPGAEPFTCEMGGWAFINWLKKENLFLIPLDAENRWFRFHHLFRKLLFNQLKRHCSAAEISALHSQASAWFAKNGLIEEALQHALAAGNTETAGSLVARFSHQLMNDQQWVRLERCLFQLPRDQIERNPALLVLEAWLYHVRHNYSGVATCIERIEALNATAPPVASVNLNHVQGLFEALKGTLHYMAAEGGGAIACFEHSLRYIPYSNKRGRLLAHTGQVLAYQMVGDSETGLSIYQKAMERQINRDNNYQSLLYAATDSGQNIAGAGYTGQPTPSR